MFDPTCAVAIGLSKAVLMHNIMFWIKTNSSNNRNLHDGRYWMYNSADAFQEFHPYWNGQQIKRMLKQLEDDGWLVSGNYNSVKYDRTKWYSLSDKSISQNWTIHGLKMTNGKFTDDPPIPENTQRHTIKNPIVPSELSGSEFENPNNSSAEKSLPKNPRSASSQEIETQFNSLWERYDKKAGKAQSLRIWKGLSQEDRTIIMSKVSAYVKSTPDKKFRKALTTWINKKNRLWEDEVQTTEDFKQAVRVCTERIPNSTKGKVYFIDKKTNNGCMNTSVSGDEFRMRVAKGEWEHLGDYKVWLKNKRLNK